MAHVYRYGVGLFEACWNGVYNWAYRVDGHVVYKGSSEEARKAHSDYAIGEINKIVKNRDYYHKQDITELNIRYKILDEEGKTPLILATMHDKYGHFNKVAKLLIDSGADLDIQDKKGMTALMGAIYNAKNDKNLDKESSKEIAKLLIESGANLKLKNNNGKTAYDMALGLSEIRDAIIAKDPSFAPNEPQKHGGRRKTRKLRKNRKATRRTS